MVADQELDLDEQESVMLALESNERAPASTGRGLVVQREFRLESRSTVDGVTNEKILSKVRYHLPISRAAARVRRIDHSISLAALRNSGYVWIAAEWGSGADSFVRFLRDDLGIPERNVFHIEISDYSSKEQFLDLAKSKLGFTIEHLCDALSNVGQSLLIFDDAPVTLSQQAVGKLSVEKDIESILAPILAYCPDLKIVVRSTHRPEEYAGPLVTLGPLDEADLRLYVVDHEKGGSQYTAAIGTIFRHTDGVPARIDSVLRDLEVISPEELARTDADLSPGPLSADAPAGLAEAIKSLAASDEGVRARSFELLKALSTFPQGETLERLKRFYGPHPIFPAHARELLDSSLITTNSQAGDTVDATISWAKRCG